MNSSTPFVTGKPNSSPLFTTDTAPPLTIVDTHCHLYMDDFASDLLPTIQRAKDAGLAAILLPSTDPHSLPQLLHLHDAFPSFAFPMIGLHPTNVDSLYTSHLHQLEDCLHTHPFIAIGEIGLDLHHDSSFLPQQLDAFEQQLRWSIDLNLPVSIHIRDAFDLALDVIQKVGPDRLSGVLHSFSGSPHQLTQALQLTPFFIGVSGVITFRNAGLDQVLKDAPLDRLLLETDAPFLAPTPLRGKRNEPAFITHTLTKLADTLHTPLHLTAHALLRNTASLFPSLRPLLLFLPLFLTLLSSCQVDDALDRPTSTNDWIYQTLSQNYLWYHDIPDKNTLDFSLPPEQFFLSLLSPQDGYTDASGYFHPFSYLEKNDDPDTRLSLSLPLIKDTILSLPQHTVAYLFYNRFDPGTDDDYDNLLRATFRRFKDAHTSDCILDLRYNGGGFLSSCQLLTSLLAPASALGKPFLSLAYNDKRQQQNHTMYFLPASSLSDTNLDLNRLFVLIGSNTASASEALINALIPYLSRQNITLIGQTSIGKTVGSSSYGDNQTYGYTLHPITFSISNAHGNADYSHGFLPDYPISLPSYILYPLGDPRDPLIAKALDLLSQI
jgi:TatD DNase family protein